MTQGTEGACWAEFLCGPLTPDQHASARRLAHTLVPFGPDEASEAPRLFNHAGRRRGSFADCVIGATAIVAGAELATANPADFERFVAAGLALAEGCLKTQGAPPAGPRDLWALHGVG